MIHSTAEELDEDPSLDHVYMVKATSFDKQDDKCGVEAIMGVYSTLADANEAVSRHTDNLIDKNEAEGEVSAQTKDDGTHWYEWRDAEGGGDGFRCSVSTQERQKLWPSKELARSETSSIQAGPPSAIRRTFQTNSEPELHNLFEQPLAERDVADRRDITGDTQSQENNVARADDTTGVLDIDPETETQENDPDLNIRAGDTQLQDTNPPLNSTDPTENQVPDLRPAAKRRKCHLPLLGEAVEDNNEYGIQA